MDFSAERCEEYQVAKEAALERILGPMEDIVGHAIIPFIVGGTVDMYYFCSYLPETVFATMELINPDGKGPKPNLMGTYELVACSRLRKPQSDPSYTVKAVNNKEMTSFDVQERRICGTFTSIGFYSYQTVLKPGETCEIPGDDESDTKCIVFDKFDTKGIPFKVEDKAYGLLLCIEVHRSEMEYAMKNGSASLLAKLKKAGVYPYSDLDRESVV